MNKPLRKIIPVLIVISLSLFDILFIYILRININVFSLAIILIKNFLFLKIYGVMRSLWKNNNDKKRKIVANNKNKILQTISNPPINDRIDIKKEVVNSDGVFEGFIIEINNVKLLVKTQLDLILITDIFLRNIYGIYINSSTIVIDIGANIGYSSLWFANNQKVKKVYSFEPVVENFYRALKSVDLNPSLKQKIDLKNFGLSNNNFVTQAMHLRNHHTITSVVFPQDKIQKDLYESVDIHLVDAREALGGIIIQNQNRKKNNFLLKIDCEGSEYNILNCLSKDIWAAIDVILMEAHGYDYRNLLEILKFNNFNVISTNHKEHKHFGHLCDIYAIKANKSI